MAWGIRSLRVALKDPFVRARLRTTLLYFLFMVTVLSTSGYILDAVVRLILSDAFSQGKPVTAEDLADQIQLIRTILRCVNIVIFTIGAYVLVGVTFAPIRSLMETQKRFIANVSHEIKTPLTVLRTETEVALRRRDMLSREEAIALLEQNVERIEHIARIIQFFRLMADYASPQGMHERAMPLSLPVRSALEQLADRAEARSVKLATAFPPESECCVEGNQIAIEKLALNLIRNAIAHAPMESAVAITIRSTSETVALSVRDQGTGIADEDVVRIFEPFERGSNAVPNGSGLGLSIVREVARLHNATLSVDTELGKGSEFTVVFKRAAAIPMPS